MSVKRVIFISKICSIGYFNLPIALVLFGTFLGCTPPTEYLSKTNCSDVEIEMLDSIQAGNVEYLKAFFKNGGDPMFECFETSRLIPGTYRLVHRTCSPNASTEMIQTYLNQKITATLKDDLLTYFIGEDPNIIQLLVDSNARIISETKYCLPLDTARHNSLDEYGHDYDYVYPEDGRTDFLEYSGCPCPEGAGEIIATLEYLISKGADPKRIDKQRKTALDHAVHPAIKAYLKSL